MLDIVSFETAKKLKEAGFPQPEYVALGFGYTDDGTRFYIEECRFPMGGVNGMYFAPTATDILRQIPGADLKWNGSTFVCKYRGKVDDANPAECAAKMWFKIFANA